MAQVYILFLFFAAHSIQRTVKWTLPEASLPEIGLLWQETRKAWALQFHTLQKELQLAVQGYSARFSILRTLELKPGKFTEAFSDSQFTFLIMHGM